MPIAAVTDPLRIRTSYMPASLISGRWMFTECYKPRTGISGGLSDQNYLSCIHFSLWTISFISLKTEDLQYTAVFFISVWPIIAFSILCLWSFTSRLGAWKDACCSAVFAQGQQSFCQNDWQIWSRALNIRWCTERLCTQYHTLWSLPGWLTAVLTCDCEQATLNLSVIIRFLYQCMQMTLAWRHNLDSICKLYSL